MWWGMRWDEMGWGEMGWDAVREDDGMKAWHVAPLGPLPLLRVTVRKPFCKASPCPNCQTWNQNFNPPSSQLGDFQWFTGMMSAMGTFKGPLGGSEITTRKRAKKRRNHSSKMFQSSMPLVSGYHTLTPRTLNPSWWKIDDPRRALWNF